MNLIQYIKLNIHMNQGRAQIFWGAVAQTKKMGTKGVGAC